MVRTLCEVSCVSTWYEMVTTTLKPGKMLAKLERFLTNQAQSPEPSKSSNNLMLITDIILLGKALMERDNLWKSAYDVMVSKEDLTSSLLEHLRSSSCSKEESTKILNVLTKCKMNSSERSLAKDQEDLSGLEENGLVQDWERERKCPPEKQVAKIEEVVENLSKYVENNEVISRISSIASQVSK